MREFLASGMCCLMIVHLKVVLYGNSFFHLEVKLHSRPLYLCCLLSWGAGNAVCLASVTWRNGLGLRFGFGVVHFPSRINSTRFHHKKIDVSVVQIKGIQNPFLSSLLLFSFLFGFHLWKLKWFSRLSSWYFDRMTNVPERQVSFEGWKMNSTRLFFKHFNGKLVRMIDVTVKK